MGDGLVDIVIREANRKDAELLRSIEARDGFDYPYKKTAADYINYMNNGDTFFIAEAKDNPVGYISLMNSDYIRYAGRLHFLAVVKDAQGMRVGTKLITHLESEAKKRGLQRVFVNVYENNPRAVEFYEKQGYKFWFEIPYLYETGISAKVYYKDIGPRFVEQMKAREQKQNL